MTEGQPVMPRPPLAVHVMTKPIGPICNLDCAYCFYLDKTALYPGSRRWAMTDDLLELYIRQYIEAQEVPEVNFAWQGGEPSLLGVRFFRKAVELQRKYARGKRITNAFQTNGTLLDDEWCCFLHDNEFLVGLSLDGPREMHDTFRRDKLGRPTFDAVMHAVELMQRHGVEFNILTVVNRVNSRHPLDLYRFFKSIGARFLQFIPLVERLPDDELLKPDGTVSRKHALAGPSARTDEPNASVRVAPWSVEPEQFGRFLCDIYDEWIRTDVGTVFVQAFDTALGIWAGYPASLCVFAETCGQSIVVEHNGDVYACDHFVYPEYRLGNLRTSTIRDIVRLTQQRAFGDAKRDALPDYCRRCDVLFACRGECPKHRFQQTPDGQAGLSYLCPSYKRFFTHIRPTMEIMTELLKQQRAPADIMHILAQRRELARNVGRNDPCPCGSGRKFKHCCGRKV